jgi:hypothetical protein
MVSSPSPIFCLPLNTSSTDAVISSAVLVLKYLVQSQLNLNQGDFSTAASQSSPLTIISHLARRIDDIKHAQARACVLWLVGQYAGERSGIDGEAAFDGMAEWAPDVLRKAAKGFMHEVRYNHFSIYISHCSTLDFDPGSRSQTPNYHPCCKAVCSQPDTPSTPAPGTICLLPCTIRQGLRRP